MSEALKLRRTCEDCFALQLHLSIPGCDLGYETKYFLGELHMLWEESVPAEPCPKPKTKQALTVAERKK